VGQFETRLSRVNTPDVSIIIPVFNNETTFTELVCRLGATFDLLNELSAEFIIVDDGSADNSWSLIQLAAQTDKRVIGVRLLKNSGQHAAISAGLQLSRGSIFCLMDADLQDEPELITSLLDPIIAGEDMSIGVEINRHGKPLSSQIFHRCYARASRGNVTGAVLTYRAFSRAVADAALEYSEFDIVYGPLMSSLGFNAIYVPMSRKESVGTSYTWSKRLGLGFTALSNYSNLLPKYLLFGAAFAGSATVVYSSVVLWQALFMGSGLPGGTTLVLLVCLGIAALLLASSSIQIYLLAKVLGESKKRPRFRIVESTDDGQSIIADRRIRP